MASVSELKNQLSSLENQKGQKERARSDAKGNRDKAKKRLDKVKGMRKDLDGDFDNNCRDVNKCADSMVSNAYDGLQGMSVAGNLDSAAEADKECVPERDGDLKSALDALDQEISELTNYYNARQNEMNQCDNDISRLKGSINSKKREIRDAEAEERKKALKNFLGF